MQAMADYRSVALAGMTKQERAAFIRDEVRTANSTIASISKVDGSEYDGTHSWFSRACNRLCMLQTLGIAIEAFIGEGSTRDRAVGELVLLCEPLQDEELHLAVSIPAPADDAEDEAKAAYAALSRDMNSLL